MKFDPSGLTVEVRRDTVNCKTNLSAKIRLIQTIPSPTKIYTIHVSEKKN